MRQNRRQTAIHPGPSQENCKVVFAERSAAVRRRGRPQGGLLFCGKEPSMHAATLLDAFFRLDDPRSARGVRQPFAGMVVLMLLGMLARIREMEVLVRWATIHWDRLREPLGFDRDEPPCATTISRTLAKCRVAEFQAALSVWMQACLADKTTEGVVAVDGKTAKQGARRRRRSAPASVRPLRTRPIKGGSRRNSSVMGRPGERRLHPRKTRLERLSHSVAC